MPKLTIDRRDVEVPDGTTVLEAARKLGINIPALCFREGCTPSTSCLVCIVRVGDAKMGTGPICAKHPEGRSGKLDLTPFSG